MVLFLIVLQSSHAFIHEQFQSKIKNASAEDLATNQMFNMLGDTDRSMNQVYSSYDCIITRFFTTVVLLFSGAV